MDTVNIMLVEDSGIQVADIEETLEDESIRIEWVHKSGEDALDQLESASPDLVLMDINLEGDLDGVEATERIREEMDVPVVYLTAYSNEKYMERVEESDALAFLVKPLEKQDLRRIIEWIQSDGMGPRPDLKRGEFL
jgi:CheY-like chemotaxis protein